MPTKNNFVLPIVFFCAFASCLNAQTPEQAAERLREFLGRFPDRGPGFAVVVVTPEKTLLKYTDGMRRSSSKQPLTNDTPIYIASQTKAYVGLLAARLHEEGILSLDDSIADHWPDIELPGGLQANDYKLRDLLGHSVPIEAGFITFMEAYITELDAQDYPQLIAQHASKRKPGFRYDNLGYNVWAAILHKATGKSWRTWLDEKIFDPLEMEHTSSRTSDFSLHELSWNHVWQGEEDGWHEVRPKTDAMMQSAGGLVTSVNDMAKWLQLQLKGNVLSSAGFSNSTIDLAHKPVANVDPALPNPYELPCNAYCLGWNICDFEGRELFIHGGGYTGARTMMAFSPEMGAGIAVFSNSDNMTGWLTSRTTVQFFQYLIDHEKANVMADLREKVYPERIEKLLSSRIQRIAENRAQTTWKGWKWNPSNEDLLEFTGDFSGDSKYQFIQVELEKNVLFLKFGDQRVQLEPATTDLFGYSAVPMTGPDPVRFERDADNSVVALELDGDRFVRSRDSEN